MEYMSAAWFVELFLVFGASPAAQATMEANKDIVAVRAAAWGKQEPGQAATSTDDATLGPPASLVDARGAVRFRLIPGGVFAMGCTGRGRGCDSDERPAHAVEVTKPFYMAETETTNAQYRRCVEAGVCPAPRDRLAFDDPPQADHPVVHVSWNDATSFCRWIGARLPTEAEWEYTARGGIAAPTFPWGDDKPVCRFEARNGAKFDDDDLCDDTGTEPAGSYPANGYGIYDTAGNVWEWVDDWYGESYYGRAPRADPSGPSSGTLRILRGGSWLSAPVRLRVTNRLGSHPGSQLQNAGFRCARSAGPGAAPDDRTPLSQR